MALDADGNEIGTPPEGQVQQTDNITLEQHKALEAEYTRVRQAQIEAYVELVGANPKKILDLTDYKLQNAVVKKIYGLENLQAVKAVYGENFLDKRKEEGEMDDTERFRRELNMLKYSQEQDKLSAEINMLKLSNPSLDNEESMRKLDDELKNISKDLPVAERVKKAAMLAFPGSTADETALAYRKMAEMNVNFSGGGSANKTPVEQKEKFVNSRVSTIKEKMGWK